MSPLYCPTATTVASAVDTCMRLYFIYHNHELFDEDTDKCQRVSKSAIHASKIVDSGCSAALLPTDCGHGTSIQICIADSCGGVGTPNHHLRRQPPPLSSVLFKPMLFRN